MPNCPEFVVKNYRLSHAAKARLLVVLREASPFLSPLSLPMLLELLYIEAQRNPELRERAKTAKADLLSKGVGATVRVNVAVTTWLEALYGGSAHASLCAFISWVVNDWEWIRPRLTYCRIPT